MYLAMALKTGLTELHMLIDGIAGILRVSVIPLNYELKIDAMLSSFVTISPFSTRRMLSLQSILLELNSGFTVFQNVLVVSRLLEKKAFLACLYRGMSI